MTALVIMFIVIALLSFWGPKNVLSCGIFGYAGTPEFPGDMAKIALLGKQNDARGGNGCGLFHDGTLYKSVNPPKIGDFLKNKRFPAPKKHYSILGHCRRATVGAHTEGNTHPFAVRKDQTSKIALIGMHNGTISNWEELCKDVGIDDHKEIEVDSLGLLTVLANAKKGDFKVLSHYIGGAALAWVYASNPSVMFLFHGESKSYAASAFTIEERPLFVWDTSLEWDEENKEFRSTGQKGIYFSSTKDSLEMIGALEKEVQTLPTNEVWKIEKGELIKVMDVDRSDTFQNKSTVTSYDYTAYSGNAGFSGNGYKSRTYLPPVTTSNDLKITLPDPNLLAKMQGKFDMQEMIWNDHVSEGKQTEGKVFFSRGLYWRGEHVMHSRIPLYRFGADKQPIMIDVPFYIEPDGTVLFHTEGEARKMEPCYFYRGFLCANFEAYGKLVERVEQNTLMWSSDYATHIHPSTFCIYNDQGHLNTQAALARARNETGGNITAHGDYEPPFSGRQYTFNYGKLVSVTREVEVDADAADEEQVGLIKQELEELQIEFKTRLEEMTDLYKEHEGAQALLTKLTHLNHELNELTL